MIAEKRDRASQAKLADVMERVERLNAAVYWLTYSPFLQPFTVRPKTAEDLKPEAERIKSPKSAISARSPMTLRCRPDLGPGDPMYGDRRVGTLAQAGSGRTYSLRPPAGER